MQDVRSSLLEQAAQEATEEQLLGTEKQQTEAAREMLVEETSELDNRSDGHYRKGRMRHVTQSWASSDEVGITTLRGTATKTSSVRTVTEH